MTKRHGVMLLVVWSCRVSGVHAQAPVQAFRVFLDCSDNCFDEFVRDEVDFVEYVRDPREADVHVIITSSTTGSGGPAASCS